MKMFSLMKFTISHSRLSMRKFPNKTKLYTGHNKKQKHEEKENSAKIALADGIKTKRHKNVENKA